MMKKKGIVAPKLSLSIPPPPVSLSKNRTDSGDAAADLLFDGNTLSLLSLPQPIQPAASTENQLSLEDFDAVKVIGKGSGGIVRLVIHKWTSQCFALKMNIEESARRHIARELKINRSYTSRCPHIVTCHNSFYENGVISILLEYMDAGSLADFLKKVHIIPEPFLAAICKQVLKGLWYLHHEKHIIHRDLKPSNLLINQLGEVKITDFGVSAILASTSGLADTVVGTYNYMSPERIRAGNYGYRSDIWSLGLVVLECATGQFPFSSPQSEGWVDVYELMETVVNQPAPRAPPGEYSPEFCSFISACVQKDPKDRLSANELMVHCLLQSQSVSIEEYIRLNIINVHPFITKYENLDIDLALYFTIGSPDNA